MGDSKVPGNYARPGDGSRWPGQPLVPQQYRPRELDDPGAWGLPQAPRYEPSHRRHEPSQPQYPRQPHPPQHSAPPQAPFSPPPQYPPPGYAPKQPQYAPSMMRPRGGRSHTARNVVVGVGSIIVVIVGIAVGTNSGHSVKTAGSTPAAAGVAAATARTGSAITLSGNGSGERAAVTVTKVIATAQPADAFNAAAAGKRLYAVQFRLRDTGRTGYSDAPSNGATVVDSAGQSYDSSLDDAAGCASFATPENIAPGASGLGCVVFEVPKSAKITQVQFTLDSGMGPDTGQWNVG
jgi:hypothetical protein